jgi:predicted homoserine dehydrogenase-like protein
VDFAIGDVNPGVFVVFTTGNKRLQEGLAQRDMGNGPYYNLFRPFHLCSCEVPLTVARAVFYGESSGHPMDRPVSECFPIAKRNLTKGETLDAIGETCYRGSIDLAVTARAERLLPLGLASGMTLTRDVARDTPLTWDVVNPGKETKLLELRRNQDKVHW